MGRLKAALLLAGCLNVQVWAQTPQGQAAPAPAAEQESPHRGTPAKQTSAEQTLDESSSASAKSSAPAAMNELLFNNFREFSATTGSLIPGHDDEVHIYRSGNKMRTEDSATLVHGYYVTDLEKLSSIGVSPAGGCIKLAYPNTRSFPFMLTRPDIKVERAPVGEETYEGHLCKIEDLKITTAKAPPLNYHFKVWEAQDLQGFPIKIENNIPAMKRWQILYKNLVLGPPDPTVFIVPNDCQATENFKVKKPANPGKKSGTAPASKPPKAPTTKPQ
jgi:hypothetical protein